MSWKQDLNLYVFWWFMISRSTILLFHAAAASAALPGRLQDGSWDHGQGQGKGSRPLAPNPVFDCVFFHSFRCNQFNKTLSWWWNALLNFQNLSCVFLMIWRFSANFFTSKKRGQDANSCLLDAFSYLVCRALWLVTGLWLFGDCAKQPLPRKLYCPLTLFVPPSMAGLGSVAALTVAAREIQDMMT